MASTQTQAPARKRKQKPSKAEQAVRNAVADALTTIADQYREGTELEEMAPALTNECWSVYLSVYDEIRAVLSQHRDHGPVENRLLHNKGMVLAHVRDLPMYAESPTGYAEYLTLP